MTILKIKMILILLLIPIQGFSKTVFEPSINTENYNEMVVGDPTIYKLGDLSKKVGPFRFRHSNMTITKKDVDVNVYEMKVHSNEDYFAEPLVETFNSIGHYRDVHMTGISYQSDPYREFARKRLGQSVEEALGADYHGAYTGNEKNFSDLYSIHFDRYISAGSFVNYSEVNEAISDASDDPGVVFLYPSGSSSKVSGTWTHVIRRQPNPSTVKLESLFRHETSQEYNSAEFVCVKAQMTALIELVNEDAVVRNFLINEKRANVDTVIINFVNNSEGFAGLPLNYAPEIFDDPKLRLRPAIDHTGKCIYASKEQMSKKFHKWNNEYIEAERRLAQSEYANLISLQEQLSESLQLEVKLAESELRVAVNTTSIRNDVIVGGNIPEVVNTGGSPAE